MTRTAMALVLALGVSACATTPVVPQRPPEPSYEQKMSWILGLEDQRILRDPQPAEAAVVPSQAPRSGRIAPAPQPLPEPDLVRLLSDGEARVRRRAALAIGRVGLTAGVLPLAGLLRDSDPEVRQMAAFALGLLGSAAARESLIAALDDVSFAVKGSAAEALGRIGDAASVQAVERMASGLTALGSLEDLANEPIGASRDTPGAAFRLALYALARLKSYEAIAALVLDSSGHLLIRNWPVAYALQQVRDERALPALIELARESDPYTRRFATSALGTIQNPAAAAALVPLVSATDRTSAVEGIRALAQLKWAAAVPQLLETVRRGGSDSLVRSEAIAAIGEIGVPESEARQTASSLLIDSLGDGDSSIRAAAIRALARLDPGGFMMILSGLDTDDHWSVRAALASVLGSMPPETGMPRLRAMLADPDSRVVPPVLGAIAKLRPDGAEEIFMQRLTASEPSIRAAAASALATLKTPSAVGPLVAAFQSAQEDSTPEARVAILAALGTLGDEAVARVLTQALADRDWAVRATAAELARRLDPQTDAAERIRPVPVADRSLYQAPRITSPPFSTQAYVETTRGLIQLELAVLDAPLTVEHFVQLARAGYFDGLPIDWEVPGGSVGFGGHGAGATRATASSVRGELNELPFLRGTIGLFLEWGDAGGGRFFIAPAPQPQLDGRHTVLGRVVSGIDVLDQLAIGDEIRRVRIWDGLAPVAP